MTPLRLLIATGLLLTSFTPQAQTDTTLYGYIDSITFRAAEIAATYPGGKGAWSRFLEKNLQYPKKALRKNIEGIVIIEFTVSKNAHTSDYAVVQSIDPDLDKEALRLIEKSGMWMPAIAKGKQVAYRTRMKIEFRIE